MAAFAVFGRERTSKLGVLEGEANLDWVGSGGDNPGRPAVSFETSFVVLLVCTVSRSLVLDFERTIKRGMM